MTKTPANNTTKAPLISSKYIYKNVYFNNSPKDQYYITIRYNLVKVNSEGLEIIGKMAQSNNGIMLTLSNQEILKINSDGAITNSSNKKVGFIAKHRG